MFCVLIRLSFSSFNRACFIFKLPSRALLHAAARQHGREPRFGLRPIASVRARVKPVDLSSAIAAEGTSTKDNAIVCELWCSGPEDGELSSATASKVRARHSGWGWLVVVVVVVGALPSVQRRSGDRHSTARCWHWPLAVFLGVACTHSASRFSAWR